MNEPTIADLPCRCCDGRGLFPRHVDAHTLVITEYHDWTCPICQARGVMRLQFPDVSVNCGPCQGTGRRYKKVYTNSTCEKCETCGGFGLLSMTGVVKLWQDGRWKGAWR